MDYPSSWNITATGGSAAAGGLIIPFYRNGIVKGPAEIPVTLLYSTWAGG